MANQPFLNRFADQKEVSVLQVLQGVVECDLFNPVFWYVKYLMIFTLAAAALGLLFRKRAWAPICTLLLAALYLSPAGAALPGLLAALIFWGIFFLLGVILCLYPEVGAFWKGKEKPAFVLSLAGYAVFFVGYYHDAAPFWSLGYHVFLAWFFWNVARLCSGIRPPQVLTHTFFLYASHWLIARYVNKLICVIFNTDRIWGMVSWVILPPIIVLVCFLARKILSGKLNPVWETLNGGR